MIYTTLTLALCALVTQICWRRNKKSRFLQVCNILCTVLFLLAASYALGHFVGSSIR